MRILGIESTCDETACSIVEDGTKILSNVVSSQIDLHREFGGVVPELACRRHIDIIAPVLQAALENANVTLDQIDAIAVAKGPGLIGALLIGMHFAKALAISRNIPLIGVNHIEAHLYAAIMSHGAPTLPALGAVLSGGHTSLVEMQGIGNYKLIGETVDDAIGESFDKVAKMVGLAYPGGPNIEQRALRGNLSRFHFKAGRVKSNPLNFSFSGIKTSVLYTIRDMPKPLSEQDIADISCCFQEAVFTDVIQKAKLALDRGNYKALYIGGGVTLNKRLRLLLSEHLSIPIYWPNLDLCLDNAAMIAGLAYHKEPLTSYDLECETRIPFAR
ncbi:MAG: tRNA (adenosine(37)-N6)-threonylcarbamoyltransferase complex transferase subunit TsaD [Verrucomicrobia bacterium]|nr:tRNA (adenosine(37)-N6)-threonylcarbamoyltransferase complex transferase subunit TsaD [Verrucomicrobiota bacterium]MBS0637827.1 tRNA (adenosine(37)-N6)-threonylcarbamoyltransferase complex transferase subunit TsaD [Verrucomicrobiota bacterium]